MQSVGEKLKEARLKKQVSLEEVYKQTKIHSQVLQALEQDRAHNFLSLVYIKAFLKTYAQYLGLDSEGILKEYLDSQKIEPAPWEIALEKKVKVPQEIDSFLIFRIVLVVILVFAFVLYLRYVLKHISGVGIKTKLPRVEAKIAPLAIERAEKQDLLLEVRTKQDCWLKVKVDNQSIFEGTLPKGKTEQWRGKQKLELRIGKPEAVEVLLNGKPVELKKLSDKRNLVITHEGIVGK